MPLKNHMHRIHHLLGKSHAVTKFAGRIRNQASAVVASHFTDMYPPAWNADPAVNGEYSLIDVVAPTAHNFVDIGANVGIWSSRFVERMKVPCGLIVDGSLQCFEILQAKFSGLRDLTVLHAALSDYRGESIFYEDEGKTRASSSLSPPSRSSPSGGRLVNVSTLDDEVEKLGWTKVSMVKIDAEGHDFFVLRGGRKLLVQKKIDFVQFECNSTWVGINIAAAVHYLAEFGYQTFQLCRGGLRKIDTDRYGSCGIGGNWLAFHAEGPNLPLRRFS